MLKLLNKVVDRAIERLLPHFREARLKSLTTIIQSSIITMNTNFSIYSFLLSMEIEFAIGEPPYDIIPITQLHHYNLLIFLNFIQTSTLNLSPLYIKYNIVLLAKYQFNLHHLSFKSLHIK